MYPLLILALLLLVSGCIAPSQDEPLPSLVFLDPPGDEDLRICLDEAVEAAGEPVFLIIGRDVHPDGTAASWAILVRDPEGAFRMVYITPGEIVFTEWEGRDPERTVDPGTFPFPSEPAPVIIWEGARG
ncbi:hypothetical protein RJ53_10305 [Methanocalculus chunghsingensis]|uniref:Uncharacterized protein n=1 Tax=Methanocalculus chunghsingensis TaxID=156457 RepID=A0A8J7WBV9_9EURY|nr:hypothetical protein [Methanocalculus chunghsingensis]MBR1369847.1 hypothetical protein [Methanocalculus chunghsingensis]